MPKTSNIPPRDIAPCASLSSGNTANTAIAAIITPINTHIANIVVAAFTPPPANLFAPPMATIRRPKAVNIP